MNQFRQLCKDALCVLNAHAVGHATQRVIEEALKQPETIEITKKEAEVVHKLLSVYDQGRQHGSMCECDHCEAVDAAGNLHKDDFASLERKVGWP